MESSDIKIDKDGIWYYQGAHMFRKDILCVFFEHLEIDDAGKYFIELNGEIYYIDVEDTPVVVVAVYLPESASDGQKKLVILLSDDSMEDLDLGSVCIGDQNVMYCRIRQGKFLARFTRKSYYQLAQFIEPDDAEQYYIVVNNNKYPIKTK